MAGSLVGGASVVMERKSLISLLLFIGGVFCLIGGLSLLFRMHYGDGSMLAIKEHWKLFGYAGPPLGLVLLFAGLKLRP
jgi:hypothetical protein